MKSANAIGPDNIPVEVWTCLRESALEFLTKLYNRTMDSSGFEVMVGLQVSAVSPCLFAMVIDRLTDEIRQEASLNMIFADAIMICGESKEQVEEKLECWRYVLERRGMKVNRRNTEYMCVNERHDNGTVRMQGEDVMKVNDFIIIMVKLMECGREVKKSVQVGWNWWRRMSGVICDM